MITIKMQCTDELDIDADECLRDVNVICDEINKGASFQLTEEFNGDVWFLIL